jgi:hypothetical protein
MSFREKGKKRKLSSESVDRIASARKKPKLMHFNFWAIPSELRRFNPLEENESFH